MQLPYRPKQKMKQLLQEDEPLYLTKEAIQKMRRRLKTIEEQDLPQAIEDVRRTGEFGDFSENEEYKEAKARMRRLHNQVTRIKEQLKVAIEIEPSIEAGIVQMGCTVTITNSDGDKKTYVIVGPQEADPFKGKVSFKSPLGAKLMGRSVGETIVIKTPTSETTYIISQIQ